MSVSISFSRTISPETACDTLITVARSRCSTGAPIVLVGAGRWLFLAEVRIQLVELPHLAIGSPAQIAVAGVPQIHMGNLLEATRRVEARGEFVGERLVVDKAVGAGRADGLFVEPLGIELAAFDAGDLRADQRGAVLEILRAILGPDLELSVVGGQCLDSAAGARSAALRYRRTRLGRARRRNDTPPFRRMTAMSRAAVAPFDAASMAAA